MGDVGTFQVVEGLFDAGLIEEIWLDFQVVQEFLDILAVFFG